MIHCQTDPIAHKPCTFLYSTQRTSVVATTHVHINARQREHPCGRRLLGHKAVELVVPSVPLDGIKRCMLQVIIAG